MRIEPTTFKFLTIWLLLAGGTCFFMLREEQAPLVAKPIAKLTKKTGDVDYRPEELLLWQTARAKQAFGNGDRIATGPGASAVVTLVDGRLLDIGEDALIVLSQEPGKGSSGAMSMVLTVTKGTLKVRSTPKPLAKEASSAKQAKALKQNLAKQVPLTIRVDNKAVEVDAGASDLKIEKKIDEPVLIAEASGTKVTQVVPVAAPPATAPPAAADATPLGAVAAAPPPLPPLEANGYEPDIELFGQKNPANLSLWTTHDLTSGSIPIEVVLSPPAGLDAPQGVWTPLVKAGSTLMQGRSEWQPQKLQWPLSAGLQTAGSHSFRVQLQAGVRRNLLEQEARSFSNRPVSLTLQELGDLRGRAVKVLLNMADKTRRTTPAGFYLEDPSLNAGTSKHLWQLTLRSGGDLRKLLPYLQMASAIKIQAVDFTSELHDANGTWLVREQSIIARAEITGEASPLTLDDLARQLGAELAYRGPAAALLKSSLASAKEQALFIANRVYGAPFYALNNQFIRSNPNVLSFVESTGLAFFLQPVVILVNRARPHASPDLSQPVAH